MPRILILVAFAALLQGCAVYTVVDTAVDVTASAAETTVDVTTGAVGLMVPDGDDDEEAER